MSPKKMHINEKKSSDAHTDIEEQDVYGINYNIGRRLCNSSG
jgi:hypothetical protein